MSDSDKSNKDSNDRFERVYRKREVDAKLDYISDKLDEMHEIAKDNLKEARETNGRVTTLEEKMDEVKSNTPQIAENKRQIVFWRGSIYVIGALLLPVIIKLLQTSLF